MGGSEEKLQKSYFDVLGICCSSEVPLIEKILKPLDGVKDVSVIIPSRTVIVLHDTLLISQLQIVKALNQARLEANVRAYGDGNYRKKWPSPFAIACGVLLLLSFLKYFYHPFQWLALGAVTVGIFPIILKAVAAIRNFTLDINILMLIAVAGSIVLKDYWEAATIVFLFTIAEWLESRASHKATAVMSSLVNIVPQRAVLAETGEEVDADKVMVNTILAVKAGDIIPVDGIVVQGKCEVDEKTLTGESFPVTKQMESTVWAGTINLNGYISIKTTALAEDCVVARMAKLVEEAQNNQSKTQRFIDKCAKYYTPAVVAIATCFAAVPAALRVHNQSKWYHLALVILVSGCPCSLILSTPVATFCALSKAATSGLLVKGAEYLETLAKIKIMAFDKTGTITRGEFIVTDFQSVLDDFNLETLLYWVSSIESKSSHPMAAPLIDFAQSHSVDPKPDKVEEFQNFPGEGIYGRIDGKDIYVGNRKIVARAGSTTVPTLEGDAKEGKSIGYIFSGSSPAGIFCLSDVCRSGVKEAIKELKSMGIKTAMLTGDCHAAAKHAQDQLGGALEEVHAELLPEDKAKIIKEFQKVSPTAMIGDGLNDAAALATADIGISMGISGSALAMETGQVILLSNDIQKIPKAVRLARRTRRKIIENMILSVTTKAGIIALAIAGYPLVWAAVLADVGTCLLVIFNSMLLLRGAPTLGKKSCKSSAALHLQKHCCSRTAAPHVHEHGSHSSHTQQNCCSGAKTENNCMPQKCSSNSMSTNEKHGSCVHKDQLHETKHLDHGSHGVQSHVSNSSHTHQHRSSGAKDESKCMPQKCSSNSMSSNEKHGSCVHKDQLHETKHLDHGSHSVHSHDSHSSHTHLHCSSGAKAENKCMPQKCSSNSMSSNEKHGSCVHKDQLHETKHLDNGSHGVQSHVSHSFHTHQHCSSGTKAENKCPPQNCSSQLCAPRSHSGFSTSMSCGTNKCSGLNPCSGDKCVDSVQTYGDSVEGDEIHEAEHCEHGKCSTMDHEMESQGVHCHLKNHSLSSLELGEDASCNNNDCRLNHYVTEEALGNMVKACCKYYPANHEVHSECNNHVYCAAIKACMSLEKRHIGGCCKSFRKECCGNSTHFGVGFKGGLSEIVIE